MNAIYVPIVLGNKTFIVRVQLPAPVPSPPPPPPAEDYASRCILSYDGYDIPDEIFIDGVMKYLSMTVLLKARRVCMTWKFAIETRGSPSGDVVCMYNSALRRFPSLTSLRIPRRSRVAGNALPSLRKLQSLSITRNPMINDTIISRLTSLTSLTLHRTRNISGACIAKLSSINALSLSYTRAVYDHQLASMTQLTSLHLDSNWWGITERALYSLTNLASLYVRDQISQRSEIKRERGSDLVEWTGGFLAALTNLKEFSVSRDRNMRTVAATARSLGICTEMRDT